jgi:hypothetical protein
MLRTFFPKSEKKFPKSDYFSKKILSAAKAINPTFVVYCPFCETILNRSENFQTEGSCPDCEVDLQDQLCDGHCQFVTLSVREQIESYLKNKRFTRLLRKFRKYTECHMNGILHEGIISKGDFDLTFYEDGAQLNNKMGRAFMPALFLFNNIPISFQLRYPIVAAIYGGRKKYAPPRSVFLNDMAEELRKLAEDPIKYTDDKGNEMESLVFMPCVLTDHLEKQFLMNHAMHNTKFACPFCLIKGRIIRVKNFGPTFANKQFRKTTSDKAIGGGHRFIQRSRLKRFPMRDSNQRVQIGIEVAEEQQRTGNFKHENQGIKGIPALFGIPKFRETESHVFDTLHTICHGVFHDIIKHMLKGYGKKHHFAKNKERDFSFYHELQGTMTKVSEADRNCQLLGGGTKWTAYDEFQFILHCVALLCSDDDIIDHKVYKILVHLSNVVYLSHFGRMTDEVIEHVEVEKNVFSDEYKTVLMHEWLVMKWHLVDAHLTQSLKNHGNASLFDGFNMERFNFMIKSSTTAKNQELRNMVQNFILKFHNLISEQAHRFGKEAQKNLADLGFSQTFDETFKDYVKKKSKFQTFDEDILRMIRPILRDNGITCEGEIDDPFNTNLVRVSTMVRKGVVLETEYIRHRKGSKINDSYIQVDNTHFGQVQEIIGVRMKEGSDRVSKFIFVLRKFQKLQEIKHTWGGLRLFPINQFPFQDTIETEPEFHVFLLRRSTFIQKCQVCEIKYVDGGERVRIMTVYPNEWFRF